jgi:hypothetical protein
VRGGVTPRKGLMSERRANPRIKGPFDGYWDGAGTQAGRVLDLSVTGCFVESITIPLIGQIVTVAIALGEARLFMSAEVMYKESQQGFGVRFVDVSEDAAALLRHEVAVAGH